MRRDPRTYLWDIQEAAAVDHQTVWNAIESSLPPLLLKVQSLLQELDDS